MRRTITDIVMLRSLSLSPLTRTHLLQNGHKVSAPAAKKQLTTLDVYTCQEKGDDGKPCGLLCGGEDVHPLHLEVKFLNPTDKHRYVDSVRWLSKSEVDVQTKEYIKGHPLVYPHLAEGVLFKSIDST
jgi:hypothetical protein